MSFHSPVVIGGGSFSCNFFTRAPFTFDWGWTCFPSVNTHGGSSSPGIWWRFVLPVNTSCTFYRIHGFSSVSRESWETSFFRRTSVDFLPSCVHRLLFSALVFNYGFCSIGTLVKCSWGRIPQTFFLGSRMTVVDSENGFWQVSYHSLTVSPSGSIKGREILFPIHTF